ncbi:MAG: fibronectin type III domain-containing protein, partial [Planctomycetota bacterium]
MTTRQFEENMLTGLKRLFVRNKRRSNRPSRKPVLGMESLQKRELLAADLIGTHFNADEPLQWGDSFNVDGVIENDGNQSARSSYLRFYLSNNSNINTDDVFLGWKYIPSIAAGREHRFDNHQLRLPTSPPSGFTDIDNVHVGMIVDGYDYVGEGWWGERNNRNRGTGRDRDSLQVSPALRSPTLNSATATSSTEVRLNWSNVQNEDGYKVYQWHNGRQVVNHVGRNSTSYSARNLNPDATYYFRVAAYSGSVEKSSGWMEVRTPAAQTNDPNDQISEAPRSNYLGHLGDGRSGGLFRFEGGVIDSPTDVDMFAMDVAA